MSKTEEGKNNLYEAQKYQEKARDAENNTETTGPADNLRKEAAEMVHEGKDEEDPV